MILALAALCPASRVPAQAAGQPPPRRLAYTLPGMAEVRRVADQSYRSLAGTPDTIMYGEDLRYDVFLPATPSGIRGGVVFIHGGMVAGITRVSPKDDLPAYREWGSLVAAAGLVGITFSHRLTTEDNADVAADDVEQLLRTVRSRAGEWDLDPDRLCVAVFSAGGPLSSIFLRDRTDAVRCVVMFYPFLDMEHAAVHTPFRGPHAAERLAELQAFSPRHRLLESHGRVPPLFLTKAGRDAIPGINASIDAFVQAALWVNAPLELHVHSNGPHGFDMISSPDARATRIVEAALEFVRRHVG